MAGGWQEHGQLTSAGDALLGNRGCSPGPGPCRDHTPGETHPHHGAMTSFGCWTSASDPSNGTGRTFLKPGSPKCLSVAAW